MSFIYQFRSFDMRGLERHTQDLMEARDKDLEYFLRWAIPVGAIVQWHAAPIAVPEGWIRTDGSSVTTTNYPGLFGIIGYTYGGAGANFTLPTVADHIIRY